MWGTSIHIGNQQLTAIHLGVKYLKCYNVFLSSKPITMHISVVLSLLTVIHSQASALHPIQPRIYRTGSSSIDATTIRGLLIARQSGCPSGYGYCKNTGGCCPLGGDCCSDGLWREWWQSFMKLTACCQGHCCPSGQWCSGPGRKWISCSVILSVTSFIDCCYNGQNSCESIGCCSKSEECCRGIGWPSCLCDYS